MRRIVTVGLVMVATVLVAIILVREGFIDPTTPDRPVAPDDSGTTPTGVIPSMGPVRTSPESSSRGPNSVSSSPAFQSTDETPCNIEGEVLEASGAAVVGAVVTVVVDLSIPPLVKNDGPIRARSVTDDNGRFRLESIPRGFAWVLYVAHPDLASQRVPLGILRGTATPLRIIMDAGGTLKCRIVDDRASPLVGIRVEVRAEGAPTEAEPGWVGTSGATGVAEIRHLPQGNLVVTAVASAWVPASATISVPAASMPAEVTMKLMRGTPISGEVVVADGSPLVRGTCEASSVGNARSVVTTPISGGRFSFQALAPGLHVLTARTPDGASTAPINATLPLDETVKPIRLVLPSLARIDLTVTGIDGRPCADAVAWLQGQPDPHTGRPERVTWIGTPDGVVAFTNVPSGRWWVVARSGTGPPVVSGQLEVGAAGVVATTIRLTSGLLLHGVVRDRQGKPIEGAEVRARPVVASQDDRPIPQLPGKSWAGSCLTDTEGNWWLRVVPSPIRLVTTHRDYLESTSPVISLPISVEATAPDILLDKSGTISGTVASATGGADAMATVIAWQDGVENPRILSATSNADGVYVFRGLVSGRWKVKLVRRDGIFVASSDDASAGRSVDVTVDAPTRLNF